MNRAALANALPDESSLEEDRTRVRPEDLERIDVLCQLLLTLNDPAASARTIGQYLERYPVLRARIEARYRHRYGERVVPRPSGQIAALGNRELEAVLLQLLEDIVTFHCETTSVTP
jgi:hypothetical protein